LTPPLKTLRSRSPVNDRSAVLHAALREQPRERAVRAASASAVPRVDNSPPLRTSESVFRDDAAIATALATPARRDRAAVRAVARTKTALRRRQIESAAAALRRVRPSLHFVPDREPEQQVPAREVPLSAIERGARLMLGWCGKPNAA